MNSIFADGVSLDVIADEIPLLRERASLPPYGLHKHLKDNVMREHPYLKRPDVALGAFIHSDSPVLSGDSRLTEAGGVSSPASGGRAA